MKVLVIAMLLSAHAYAQTAQETWTVNGKAYTEKSFAISAAMKNKGATITHTKCEFLTNKFTFRACPKNKANNFLNLPYGTGQVNND